VISAPPSAGACPRLVGVTDIQPDRFRPGAPKCPVGATAEAEATLIFSSASSKDCYSLDALNHRLMPEFAV